jgi:hypothetical protein
MFSDIIINFPHAYFVASAAADGAMLTNAGASADMALNTANDIWKVLYTGSGIFGRVAGFAMPIAFIALMWRVYKLYEEFAISHHMQPWHMVQKLMMPLICIIMLSRSGALAKEATYGIRTLTQGFGISIMKNVGNDMLTDGLKADGKSLIGQSQVKKFAAEVEKCRYETGSGEGTSAALTCMQIAVGALQSEIQKEGVTDPAVIDFANKASQRIANKATATGGGGVSAPPVATSSTAPGWDVGKQITEGFSALGDQIVTTLLQAVTVGVYWAIELAALLSFYLLPMALAMAIADEKAIVDWFSQFWALCNAKICFAIVLALISQVAGKLGAFGFVVSLLGAFFAPAITYIFAQGSMMAVAEGLSKAPTAGASAAGRGVQGIKDKMGQRAASKATKDRHSEMIGALGDKGK